VRAKKQLSDSSRRSFSVRFPFYYGWIILVCGALGVLASIPGQTMGVSVFTDQFIEAFSLSRVGISSAYMIGTLISSLIIPFAGIFFDRKGARVTASLATVFLAVFLLLLSFTGSMSTSIASRTNLPLPGVSFTLAIVGFFGIRFFGQGVLTLVSKGIVAQWFSTRRGFAVGIMGLVTSFGFSYAPQPLHRLVNRLGLSGALVTLALLLVCLFLPIALLFFRTDPASCGMEMEEGLSVRKVTKKKTIGDAERDLTVKEARADLRYWVILASLGYWALFNTAFTFHVISIYGEIGLTADQAVSIFLPISIVSVLSRFLGSYLSDRISVKYILLVYTGALVLVSLSLSFLSYSFTSLVVVLFYGISGGLFGMLNIVTWPKLYGRKHFGAISGFAMSIVVAGSAIGPWLFSMVFRLSGSYRPAGFFGGAFATLLFLAVLFTGFSNPKVSDAQETEMVSQKK
jgi:MFS family permease